MELEPITRQEKIIAGQDLTPITRMEKFLKQFGGGGGGLPAGGAPYQQLVTDGDGNAKWEDRLAYEAFGYGEIIPEQAYSFSMTEFSQYGAAFRDITLLDGEHYSVNFDGQSYDCVWQNNEALGVNCFGNLSWAGLEDTGEPFSGMDADGVFLLLVFDKNVEHTVSISGYGKVVNTISEKYLPIASSGHYGIVDRDNIVTPYSFDRYAEKNELTKALGESQQAKALIRWDTKKILNAAFIQGGGLSVTFDDNPYVEYVYRPLEDGFFAGNYDITKYESIKYRKYFILSSSTSGSSKKFKITVDDSGTISATEVV